MLEYFFGFTLTLILYLTYNKLKNFACLKFLNKIPVIISVSIAIILILEIFRIDYRTYYKSASILSFLIAPATIALAYPMYCNRDILIKNKRALYIALVLASFGAIVLTYICARFFGAEYKVIMSILPKSTTMPIAVEISKSLGGYKELTAVVVVLTGIFGGVLGHWILEKLKIKNDVAIGLALGSAAHVIGTSSCVEKKRPRQIASSTIALILVGILSVLIIELFKFLK